MKIALLFPGQGAQYIGMCKQLIDTFSVAAQIFEEANEVLGYDLQKMILTGDMKELTHLAYAQPAVVTASYALYRVLVQETGLKPFCGTGHSLGEISALVAAGGISFAEGVRFAGERGAIMYRAFTEKKGRTGLLLGLDEGTVEEEVRKIQESTGFVSVCCYNSPGQFVVSGEEKALADLEKSVRKLKGEFVPFRMMPMKVDAPFHSILMRFIEEEIRDKLMELVCAPLDWMVISTVTGRPYESHESIQEYLTVQLVTPVQWRQAISYIESLDVSYVFEVGPQSSMKQLFIENTKKIRCYSFDDKDDYRKITRFLLARQLLS